MLLEERKDLIETLIKPDILRDTKNLEDFIRRNQNDAGAHCALGALYLQLYGNRSATEQECEKAIELEPSLADTYFYLGEVNYLNSGYSKNKEVVMEKAIEYYEKAVSIEPSFKLPNYKLGRIHFEKGDFDKAIERFEVITSQVEKLFDKNKIPNSLLHPFYRITRVYPEIEKKAPPDIISKKEEFLTFMNVYHFLALSYKNKGVIGKAKELTKRKIQLTKCKKREANFYLGCIDYEFGDYKEAIKKWKRISYFRKKIRIDWGWGGSPVNINNEWIGGVCEYHYHDRPDAWINTINIEKCIKDAREKLKEGNYLPQS